MKKIAFSLVTCLTLAAGAFAGQPVKESKEPIPAEPCFKDQELQIDAFATYTMTHPNRLGAADQDGFGGGIGVNYFFMRYLGVGVDGTLRGEGDPLIWNISGRLIARYPIETGKFCLAPYAFGGGGHEWVAGGGGTIHVGGGLEFRITPKIGVFTEGRYTWVGFDGNSYHLDETQIRLGARFVF